MSCVVLVNPVNDFASFKTFEVLSLGYLASYVERTGIQVHVYDCNFENPSPAAVASFCRDLAPVAVGLTSMVGTLRNVFDTASEVRRQLRYTPIICGGYSATFEYELILGECSAIDFVLRGEGEASFLQWLGEVGAQEGHYETVPGLLFREAGGIRIVPGPVLIQDLDDLPFPRRSEFLDRIGLASILSSRGCAASCTFCSIQEFYRISSKGAIRCRSARNVADEIEQIYHRTGIRRFLFIDDNFFMSERFMPGRLSNLARELIERGLKDIRFEVSSRAADLKLPQLDELVEAGLDLVYVGLESGSAAQLRRYRKGCGPTKNVWAVQEIRSRGIRLDFGFIPFDPYLEPADLMDSLNFLLEQDLITPETLNTLTVTTDLFPGTPLHERARGDGLLHRTDDYYYWFDFKDRELAPIYEEIIEYFKTRYIITVVDAYSNGFRQQGYVGPSPEEVTVWLRRLLRLWVERVQALLTRQDIEDLDRQIESVENFLSNVLSAHILLNRSRKKRADLLPPQIHGLNVVETDATELHSCMLQEVPPSRWAEAFAVERRYRQRRAETLDESLASREEIRLQRGRKLRLPLRTEASRATLIDIFIPPDIDVKPSGLPSPADLPPPTLYLGSVTGMPPIECRLLDSEGNLIQVYRLFKGWSEISISQPEQIAEMELVSRIHLFRSIEITSWPIYSDSL